MTEPFIQFPEIPDAETFYKQYGWELRVLPWLRENLSGASFPVQGDVGGGQASVICVQWHADGSANLTLTNSPLAERIALNQPTRMCKLVPLAGMTQVRLVGVQVTASASQDSPRVQLKYKTGDYSATLGNYAAIGTSSVELSLAGTGQKDTGWIDLQEAAKADVWVTLTEAGGNGVIDPAFGNLIAYFK